MTVSAHDVAAALRERLPGLGQVKLHKLLYYCQGHHLAHFDEPLFREAVSAWDMGPVVDAVWRAERDRVDPPPAAALTSGELNTVGYVVSRYGNSTATDLIHMSHGEDPWRLANASRHPGGSVRIQPEWMRDYFRGPGAPGADDEMPLDSAELAAFLAQAAARPSTGRPDNLEELRAWADRGSR